jgi:hypothetical protein
MNCPICNADLEPYDLRSRTEHIDLCVENGPSVLDFQAGRPVVKSLVPIEKQRKICPICSKTFQTSHIHNHFKTCALKNDLIPDLMQDYWFNLNDQCKVDKCFPRDLLEGYIEKCTKENRVGEQVEFAKALLETLPEDAKRKKKISNKSVIAQQPQQVIVMLDESNDSNSMSSVTSMPDSNSRAHLVDVNQALMRTATSGTIGAGRRQPNRVKTPLELADKATKKANISLRIERELAASRGRRYLQAIEESNKDEVQIIEPKNCIILKYTLAEHMTAPEADEVAGPSNGSAESIE